MNSRKEERNPKKEKKNAIALFAKKHYTKFFKKQEEGVGQEKLDKLIREKNYVERWIENAVKTVFVSIAISLAWIVSWVLDVVYISTLASDMILIAADNLIEQKFDDWKDFIDDWYAYFQGVLVGLGILCQVYLRLEIFFIFKIFLFPLSIFETFLTY